MVSCLFILVYMLFYVSLWCLCVFVRFSYVCLCVLCFMWFRCVSMCSMCVYVFCVFYMAYKLLVSVFYGFLGVPMGSQGFYGVSVFVYDFMCFLFAMLSRVFL